MRTPRPSSISVSTHCQCTTGTVRSHGWHSSSSKMPWIAMTAKLRSTIWWIIYPSKFCLFLIMLPDILLLLVTFISISECCSPSTRHLFDPNTATKGDNEKTLMQFWKDYNIYDCIQNLTWSWSDVTKECMDGIWKITLKRFAHDGKGFSKN